MMALSGLQVTGDRRVQVIKALTIVWTLIQLFAITEAVIQFTKTMAAANSGAFLMTYRNWRAGWWPRTAGVVRSSSLSSGIRFSYVVGEQQYSSKRLRFNQLISEDVVLKIDRGTTLRVAYDPNDPKRAVAFPGVVARDLENVVRVVPLDAGLCIAWILVADVARFASQCPRFLLVDYQLGRWLAEPVMAATVAFLIGCVVSGVAVIVFLWLEERLFGGAATEAGSYVASLFSLLLMFAFASRLSYKAYTLRQKLTLRNYLNHVFAGPLFNNNPAAAASSGPGGGGLLLLPREQLNSMHWILPPFAEEGEVDLSSSSPGLLLEEDDGAPEGSSSEPSSPTDMAYTAYPDGRITISV